MDFSVIVEQISDWVKTHSIAVWWLAGLSALTFVGTLIAIPFLVVRIPADYFAHESRETTRWGNRHPVIRGILIILKNVIGLSFIIAGIAMLILPGQGLLTILIGLMLIDFPGKYRLERWLVKKRAVLKSINWLRKRTGHPPINVK